MTGLADGTRLVDEEQFGPALPILTYRDVDDAVERANAHDVRALGLGVVVERRSAPRKSRASSTAAPRG